MEGQRISKTAPKTLPEAACKFLNSQAIYESSSPQTLRAYALDLEQAFGLREFGKLHLKRGSAEAVIFMAETGTRLPAFNPDTLLRTARDAQSRWGSLSPASRNRKSATLKSFFNWLYREGWLESDLAILIASPKVPVRLPHFLSLDEALALLQSLDQWVASAPSAERLLRLRQRALVLLLYGGGLRVSEACALKWSDLRKKDRILRILGKGGKERLVAVPDKVTTALSPLADEGGEHVFGHVPLDTRRAYGWVRDAGRRAGLIKPLHPHALRHSFATHLLASGANLRALQELLGHSTLQATQKYTHVSIDQLARTLERHHPLSGRKGKKN